MTIPRTLVDTDILSAVLRQNPTVILKAQTYLTTYEKFTFSIITRYEILRGLKSKKAARQLASFEQFCNLSIILPVTDAVIVKASDIYAFLKQKGQLIGDADIIIAATALVNDLSTTTNNLKHFERIPELSIQNWLEDEDTL